MRFTYAIVFIVASLLLAGCGTSSDSSAGVVATPPQLPAAGSTTGSAGGTIQINGAGATFPFPLYSRWFYEYAFVDSSAKFNYQSIGSGGGIKQITAKTVDFAGSDAILNEEQRAAAPGLQMLPAVAGAVVPTYNVSDLQDADPLVLDGAILSNIFLGKIKKWNDPAIADLNPGLTLPDKDIIVVHRSDGSGTTFIFTDYLAAVSADWKSTVGQGTSVEWPAGLGGKGNEGVAGTVSQNDGAIGYVELAYAQQNKLAVARMINSAGSTVEASPQTIQNAMADLGTDMPNTLARSIVNAPGPNSWPIAGYTYLLIYMDQTDCAKAQKLVQFIRWAQTDGGKYAEELQYVPLPDNVRSLVFEKLDQVKCNGQPVQ